MRAFASLSLLSALAFFTASASATTVFTDGFSGATVQLSATTAGNFTALFGTNVDVLGTADGFAGLCTFSTPCVDLGGTGGTYQGFLESNTFFSEGTYVLSFDLTGSKRGVTTETTIDFGSYTSTVTLDGSNPVDGGALDLVNVLVTVGPGGSYLTFYDDNGANDIGSVLNSVSVSTTPEPSSLVLLGSGLLSGAGALMRRRKK